MRANAGVRDDELMSTFVVAVLVTGLVVGIVVAMFALIYIWEKWGSGSRVERCVDRFFDRLSDMFDR